MTVWCIEHLHRLPEELSVPTAAVIGGMIAHGLVMEARKEEMERLRKRAESGWGS